ncbi:putative ribonuclease H-like domain-containing protein [Tanacetum coccineum]
MIKDCDFYDCVDFVPCKSKAASVPAGSRNSAASVPAGSRNSSASVPADRSDPAGSRNSSASVPADRSDPAASRNRPAVNSADRPNPAGWSKRPATVSAGRPVSAGIVDSGCSRSMTGNKEKLDDFVQIKGGIVKFGGGDDTDCLVLSEEFQLPDESQVVLRIPREHDLYTFSISDLQPEQKVTCLVAKASLDESTRWHRRMAHVNFKTINKLAKEGLVDGLPLKVFTNEHNCVACNKGKQHKASYKHISAVRLISADETFYVLKEFIALIENQLNKKVKGIRCDNGTEFKNAKLIELCGEKGIKRDYSNPRTPQQNGVAERKNRTLIEAARTMLADSKLPTMFWTEAVSTACYVLNRVSITNPHNKTPYQLISGKVPQIGHLKPFGCQVTILNTSDHLGKFEGKADEGYLVGYAPNSKAYRVYNLTNKRVEETLNLRFLEDKPNVQGIGHEWYFDLDYLTDSLGYTRHKTNKPAGTLETNIPAGTQDPDSDSEVDEQVIVVPSFPSNSFAGPFSSTGPSVIERNADYAEELAKLQRQEYEAKDAAARYGYLFSQATAEILSQAEAEIRNQGVSADGDPAGIGSAGGVSAGSTSAGSDSAGGNPAGSFPPAVSYEPAGQGNPAVSTSVSADFIPVHADESTLPPGQSLGSSENNTRFPVPSDVCKDQLSSGIFTSSSYDDDFSATLTNLAPAVEVNPVPTKRVNTIHPQSQILGDLASPVLTRSRAQKSKFGESAFIGYIQDQQRTNHTDQLHCLRDATVHQPESMDSCVVEADGISAGSVSAGSDSAGGNPAGSFQPAGKGNPAVSTSVSADFIPVHADESTLPPSQSLGSSENTTRFQVPSDVCKDQLSSGIFTSSSYDDDFSATLTNLAPAVEVNPVPTKRLEPTSIAKALEDPDWVAAMQEEMQQFINQKVWKFVPLPDGKNAIGTKWILKNKRDAKGIVLRNKERLMPIPFQDRSGHYMEMIDTDYEWKLPRCDTWKIFEHMDEHYPKKPNTTTPMWEIHYGAEIHTDDNVVILLTNAFDGPSFEYWWSHMGWCYGVCWFLLVVLWIPAGCYPMLDALFLLVAMDYADGFVFMLVGILLLVDSFLLIGFVYAVNTSFYADELVCAGSIMFLLADLFLLVVTCFCCLNLVSAVLSLILLAGWSLPLVTSFLLVVSNHAGVTMYLLPE